MNSVQITIDAQGFLDAIDKLNRSLMISPYAVAIGANARYLGCRDTGICDVRFPAWETSHDTRSPSEVASGYPTRIGLPQQYYQSMADYFSQVGSYPFILDDPVSLAHPFEVGLGMYWRDARLKFFQEKGVVGVEFRPVAIQPSLGEDMAMMFFYVGRLHWSQRYQEPLLPMDLVRSNKEQATTFGLDSRLWCQKGTAVEQVPAYLAMKEELNRAAEGLRQFGAPPWVIENMIQVLGKRLGQGSPAEQFAATVQRIEAGFPVGQKDRRRNAIIGAIRQLGLIVP